MNRAIRRPTPMFALLALLTLALGLPVGRAWAQDEPAAVAKGVTIEGITEYRLKNGCKFLLFPDPASSKVTINMTVLVGSRHEGYGETGMAHLLEHMLFKGSKRFPNIDKAHQAHGASNANASTWTDRTNYYESMPATDDNLAFGIELEADRLVNSFIRREDLVKEMTVVRNEFEMGENNPAYILSQRMNAVAYEWHNYGKSTIGNRTDIERVPIERLQEFYRKYYQADNIVVIVAGKFDAGKAVKLIAEHFGALPTPKRKLPQTYTEEPPQDGERVVVLRRVGKVAATGVVYHVSAAAHPDHPVVEVLSTILGDSPSGRLYKALVEKKLATDVNAGAEAWHDPGVLEVIATVAEKVQPEKVRDAMLEVIEGFAANPPTKEEVERARKRYLARVEQRMTQSQSTALQLSEWVGAGDWRLLFVYRDRVAKVTAEDISRVAKHYLTQTNRTVGVFYPTQNVVRATIPETPDVAALVKDYKGGKALAQGEEFDPTPENLEKRTKRLTLSSGIKVALLPKKTRGESVVGTIVLRYGNEQSLQGLNDATEYLGPMLMRGTKSRTEEQIHDELDKLASKLHAGGDLGSLSFSLQSKRGQLGGVLDILNDVLHHPTFPEKELGILKDSAKQGLLEEMADPQALASVTLRRQLYPYPKGHIRYVPTLAESLERLEKFKRADVERVYQQLGGAVGEIALVGDFDPEAAVKQLETIFGGWKATTPYERIIKRAFPEVKGKRDTIQTPDKENAVYAAGLSFALRDTDPDYAALLLGNYILGGSGFTSRIMDRLRQHEGWSYGAGSQLQVSSEDKVGAFVAYAICNPKVIEQVDKAALEEIRKMLKDGASTEELAQAQKGFLEKLKVSRGSDGAIAGKLQGQLQLGRTFTFEAELQRKLAALDASEVNQALARHLNADRLAIIRAGDFNKNKKK